MGKFNLLNNCVINGFVNISLNKEIKDLIKRRRRQIMVHSFIYYRLGTSVIDDKTFDRWAYQLRDLQKAYPKESKDVEMYEDFKDWDGTTGFHLNNYAFQSIAERLIKYCKNKETKI